LIEAHKISKDKNLLNPGHISNIFEFYGIENYSQGLKTAIEAFYISIYIDQEELYKNRDLVLIEIVNLINNYDSRTVKENIINNFFTFSMVNCEKIFYMDGLFQTIMSGTYNYENEQVELHSKEMIGWLEITIHFAKFVKKKIELY
jgi:hypothetical protein